MCFRMAAIVQCPKIAAKHSVLKMDKANCFELLFFMEACQASDECFTRSRSWRKVVISMIHFPRVSCSPSELQTHQKVLSFFFASSDVRYLLLSRVMWRHVEIESISIATGPFPASTFASHFTVNQRTLQVHDFYPLLARDIIDVDEIKRKELNGEWESINPKTAKKRTATTIEASTSSIVLAREEKSLEWNAHHTRMASPVPRN